jgi:hypothetical protein
MQAHEHVMVAILVPKIIGFKTLLWWLHGELTNWVKMDWCHTDGADPSEVYPKMSAAMNTSGRHMHFNLCDGGPIYNNGSSGTCRFLLLAGYENLAAPLFALSAIIQVRKVTVPASGGPL